MRHFSTVIVTVLSAALFAAEQQPVTFALVTKLAGANDLEVQLAHERSLEARANHHAAQQKFLPWLSAGLGYRKVTGQQQETRGDIVEVDKQSYALGLSLSADIELGDALYATYVTKYRIQAADHSTAAARLQAVRGAQAAYITLLAAQARRTIAMQSQTLAEEYARQVSEAVTAGIAFAGDATRAETQVDRCRLRIAQEDAAIAVAAAELANRLRISDGVYLRANDAELEPIALVDLTVPVAERLSQAERCRPELFVAQSQVSAIDAELNRATTAPLIPRVTVRGEYGGLGGGTGSSTDHFGDTASIALGVEWRIGPGGLFDYAKREQIASKVRQYALQQSLLADKIHRDVVVAHARAIAALEQVKLAQGLITNSERTVKLTAERRNFGVGIVFERITAEEELTRARLELVEAISTHNQAQVDLNHAIGGPSDQTGK